MPDLCLTWSSLTGLWTLPLVYTVKTEGNFPSLQSKLLLYSGEKGSNYLKLQHRLQYSSFLHRRNTDFVFFTVKEPVSFGCSIFNQENFVFLDFVLGCGGRFSIWRSFYLSCYSPSIKWVSRCEMGIVHPAVVRACYFEQSMGVGTSG